MDDIILKKKVWYLDPIAICVARHAGQKWMKDDDGHLKPLRQRRKSKRNDIDFTRRL